MTGFTLKVIAMIIMLIDHASAVLQSTDTNILSPEILFYMRSIGRFSLPVFAFFIVEGYLKTSNIKKYINRVHIVAIISQIPFMFAFYYSDFIYIGDTSTFSINYDNTAILIILVIIFLYWYYIANKKVDYTLLVISFAYFIIPIYINKGFILRNNLNIFYELGYSLIILYIIDKIVNNISVNIYKKITPLICIILATIFISRFANYGSNAIALCIALYFVKNSKFGQSFIIAIWGFYMYKSSILHIIFVIIAAILIYFYNGKRGLNLKLIFYAFYPLHLIILGMIKIFLDNTNI